MSRITINPSFQGMFQEICYDLEDLHNCITRITRVEHRKQFSVIDNEEHFVVSYPMTQHEKDLQLYDQAELNPTPPEAA